ncbi:MAG: LPS export ABC transporter ATP-binding protein [Gemmataceae bacterium]|nr:LPS export ABC transporter ATP-binding protein [Gemmataceae bacterium]
MAILEVRGLIKYYGSRKVVDGVSFQVDVGEVVGLLGPNGAGKTTSFRMTTGQVAPYGGRVIFAGKDVTHLPMYGRARLGMGYLAQETSVFRNLTVEQNILAVLEIMPKHRVLGRKLTRSECIDRTDKVLAKFGLSHLRKNNASRLSGGEKRRLEIARCLACDPLLILLDEPFTGIDPQTIEDIQQIVRGLRDQGIGILVTDHRVREILTITDRSYLIKGGKVRTHGSPQEIIRDPVAIQEYLGNSFSSAGIGFPVPATLEMPPLHPLRPPAVASRRQIPEVQRLLEREKILDLLGQFTTGSSRAAEELQRHGLAAFPFLLDALERRDPDLRKKVHHLMEKISGSPVQFDPFAPEAQRRAQISSLRETLARLAG